jgi:hypothetical protein
VKHMELRPLSLGEQLDRAVTLCVRNAFMFVLIYLAFSVAKAVFLLYGTEDQSQAVGGLIETLRLHKTPTSKDFATFEHPVFNGFTVALLCLYLFVNPLVQAALTFAISRVYLGSRVTFASAYREAVRFWLPLLGINVLYVVAGVALYIVAIVIGVAGAVAAGLLIAVSHGLGIFLSVVCGGIFLSVLVGTSLLVFVALYLSYFSCVAERIGVFSSFVRGMQRAFAPSAIQRSLNAVIAVGAISIGITIVSIAGVAVTYGFLRSNVVGAAFTALTEVATAIFITVFFAVFYYDLRVRREGFDLQLEIAEATSASQ